jgi:D-aspartate ligase
MSFALGRAALLAVLGVLGVSVPHAQRARAHRLRSEDETPAVSRPSQPPLRETAGELPPVLLTTPAYYGTLAAVRSLGRGAVPVTTAGPSPWAISGWSKYASTHVSCPATTDTEAFLSWLETFGREQREKHVLLPTCDDTAWLYARYRERLACYFHMGSASIETIHSLLHKGRLAEYAREAGLDVPRTWFPQTDDDLRRITREATFPVLIKPVTQVLFRSRNKGNRVDRPEALLTAYAEAAGLRHGAAIVDYDPSSTRPMVQEFFPGASSGIYNISSYAQDGKLWGARAGRKILQRPRRLGVGVCFEEAPLDVRLVQKLELLVQRVGFSGVFEAEFVKQDDRSVLIDFNPRFYNQMGFDVARGLPLPLLAYFGALPRDQAQAASSAAVSAQDLTGKVFTYGSAFKVMVTSQRLSGAFSSEEAERWLAWYDAHEGRRVDAVSDPDDQWPGRIDLVQMVHRSVRHPRDFLRSIVLNR